MLAQELKASLAAKKILHSYPTGLPDWATRLGYLTVAASSTIYAAGSLMSCSLTSYSK